MQLTSQQLLCRSQADVWQALNDIGILQACIPGCESLTQVGPDEYELLIQVAVGPVKTKFKGKLRLADLVPTESYTIHFEGQSGAAGHGKGSAQVRLEATAPEQTTLHYSAKASVGGRIAQVGSRLVDMAAQKMASDFFAALERQLPAKKIPLSSEVAMTIESTGMIQRLCLWWRRFWRKS